MIKAIHLRAINDRGMDRCSFLYPLELEGSDSEEIESLSSLINRLADAHNVKPSMLLNAVFRKYLPIGVMPSKSGYGNNSHSFSSATSYAEVAVRAFSEATGSSILRRSTLLRWAGAFDQRSTGLMRRHFRQWCPYCYESDRQQGKTPYDRLYWAMQHSSICPTHRKPLVDVCPQCGMKQLPLQTIPRSWVCDHCAADLSLMRGARRKTAPMPAEEWRTRNIRALIKASCVEQRDIPCGAFRASLERVRGPDTDGNCRGLASLLNFSLADIKRWLAGDSNPSFTSFVTVCETLRVPYKDFLMSGASFLDLEDSEAVERARVYNRRRHLGQEEKDTLKRGLEKYAKEDYPAIPLSVVAQRLNTTTRRLTYQFPDLAKRVSERKKAAEKTDKESRQSCREHAVRRSCETLIGRGVYPTARRVSDDFNMSRHHFRNVALRAVLRECQYRFLKKYGWHHLEKR